MKLIAAVDRNWAIGNQNRLLTSIPADMRFFRETTTGHIVVMGRKTLESFPGGRPLKNRINIVLTGRSDYDAEGAQVVHDLPQLFAELAQYDTDDVYVIGGESMYRTLAPYCDGAYITKIDFAYSADAYFPDLDRDETWRILKEGEEETYFDLCYRFVKYGRRQPEDVKAAPEQA